MPPQFKLRSMQWFMFLCGASALGAVWRLLYASHLENQLAGVELLLLTGLASAFSLFCILRKYRWFWFAAWPVIGVPFMLRAAQFYTGVIIPLHNNSGPPFFGFVAATCVAWSMWWVYERSYFGLKPLV